MKRAAVLAFAVILFVANMILAQAPGQMPNPGPELKKLGYFVGKWHGEGEMKPSAFGPGGKFTESEEVEWMPGGFFLLIHSDEKTPMGDGKSLMILGYNAEEKVYTFNSFDTMGQNESAKGTVEGDTWTWTSESKMGGQPFKGRFIMKILSPTSYSTKFEVSMDGSTWTTAMEGKTTKVK